MGRKGSEPEGFAAASRRWQRDYTWTNYLNLFVERDREAGAKSPKVSGKLLAIALILSCVVVLLVALAGLAWVGVIPNWKT